MTNGEMIKAIFPSAEIDIGNGGNDIWIAIDCWTIFKKEWWNAEYKEPTTKNDLGVDSVDRGKEPCYTCRFCKINSHGSIYCSLRAKGGKCYDHDSWESQEDVLDKIRAEIDELDVLRFSSGERIYKDEVLNIIDKYKAESEGLG